MLAILTLCSDCHRHNEYVQEVKQVEQVTNIIACVQVNLVLQDYIDTIPPIRALLQVIITLNQIWVWPYECGTTCCSMYQCLNYQKTVIIIWSFNCLIAPEGKCQANLF